MAIKIENNNLKFETLCFHKKKIDTITLHHRAGDGTVESIHTYHLRQGYSGIGYHYYVRKSGNVYQGRPEATIGAHVKGYNNGNVGICLEGNFTKEKPTPEQIMSMISLIHDIETRYGKLKVKNHKDFGGTVCPVVDLACLYERM